MRLAIGTVAAFLLLTTSAFADYSYTYTGRSFNQSGGPGLPAVTRITVIFVSATPLSPNTSYSLTNFSNWSISNGVNTCGSAKACGLNGQSGFSTNSAGQITNWNFEFYVYTPGGVLLGTCPCGINGGFLAGPFIDVTAEEYMVSDNWTAGSTMMGSWSVTQSSASATSPTDGPIPLWALGALGAGLMGIASRRLKNPA